MSSPQQISASLTQPRRGGDWGARSVDGRNFVVPRRLLEGEGKLAPRSGVSVVLTVAYDRDLPSVVEIRRSETQFRQSGATRELARSLKRQRVRQTRILVVGRTGVGKSSTINSLVGSHVAMVGHFEPTTSELHFYNGRIQGVPILIADTPGFADTRSDRSNDERYIEVITRLTGEIDLLLFITGLDDPRVEKGEHDTMEILAKRLSPEIWDRSIVLLTRSDRVTRADFATVLRGRTGVLKKALTEVIGPRADSIPFVPISNQRTRTPNRKQWMGELWTQMLKRISDHGFEALALASMARLSVDVGDSPGSTRADARPKGSSKPVPSPTPQGDAAPAPIPHPPAPRPRARSPRPQPESPSAADGLSESIGVIGRTPVGPAHGGRPESKSVRAASPSPAVRPADVAVGPAELPRIGDVQPAGVSAAMEVELAPVAEIVLRPSPARWPIVVEGSVFDSSATSSPTDGSQVLRSEFVDSGVKVVRADFKVENVSAVIVNAEQAQVIGQVVQSRAPGLLGTLAAAGSWIWKRVKGLFGWG